jgi:hypothetical protein
MAAVFQSLATAQQTRPQLTIVHSSLLVNSSRVCIMVRAVTSPKVAQVKSEMSAEHVVMVLLDIYNNKRC